MCVYACACMCMYVSVCVSVYRVTYIEDIPHSMNSNVHDTISTTSYPT